MQKVAADHSRRAAWLAFRRHNHTVMLQPAEFSQTTLPFEATPAT